MKKIILLSFVMATFCLSSCRKDRTCSCTNTTTVGGSASVTTTVEVVGHATKGEAKRISDCYSGKATVTQGSFAEQVTSDCKLD